MNLFVCAGEASGDQHAALVIRELLQRAPTTTVWGIGSVHLHHVGVRLMYDSSRWGAMGFVQAIPKIPGLLRAFQRTQRALLAERPDALLLVDYGAFNGRLARWAKLHDLAVLYYCPPKSWRREAENVGGLISASEVIATPFPWSAELLNAAGGQAVFVGHPVLELLRPRDDRAALRQEFGVHDDEQLIAILPGSRPFELQALLSRLLSAAALLRQGRKVRFALSLAPNLPEQFLHKRRAWLTTLEVATVRGRTTDLLTACDFAWVASGTATLEAACLGAPMVIVYDALWLSRLEGLVRRGRIGMIGMPNVIAGHFIVPELLGPDLTAARLVELTARVLDDSALRAETVAALAAVKDSLGTAGASARTAELLLNLMCRTSPEQLPHGTLEPASA